MESFDYLSKFSFHSVDTLANKMQNFLNNNPFMPLNDAVYEVLADEIVHFRMMPESRIIVSSLADEMNVSRTPVKMALQELEHDGFVKISGKGYFVSPFDPEEYQKFFRLRTELEAGAIRLTVKRITRKELEQLKLIYKELKSAYQNGDWDGITNGEQKFHQFIVDASGNPFFISAYRSLYPQIRRYRIYLIFDLDNIPMINAYHGMIVRGLETGSADVCEATIRAHLTRTPLTYEKDYLKVKNFFANAETEK